MEVKKVRQILKTLADDTRMRIINLLSFHDLNVAELCSILGESQSMISRHLMRLRLTSLVTDIRDGQFVYYHLVMPEDAFQKKLVKCLIDKENRIEAFEKDIEKLRGVKNKA
ncbi:MAG: winged helix-turn-helix transcriptional regulator [Endomicrobiales bacterium]|nr:winged helix-turn-helix transcriptional regulator [Endomicrobiales bacterium]